MDFQNIFKINLDSGKSPLQDCSTTPCKSLWIHMFTYLILNSFKKYLILNKRYDH